ncbi:MAG: DegT/DnrJ/EryC1/StrS family aminotransferase [Acidimicrobiales bacterium]
MDVPAARVVFSARDKAEIAEATSDILSSGALTLGPWTARFEAEFASAHQARHAVATSSGTAALEIILRSLNLGGADVIVPANTFVATATAVERAGGRPVLADVDADTLALSCATIEAALGAAPTAAAVVTVHIGGSISPELPAIARMCEQRGLILIEDAAHAHGSTLGGRPAGSWSKAAAFSFYPTKVITSGEGGMILTADDQIVEEALMYRDQGKAGFLDNLHVRSGYAWRMSELHAAVGCVHLSHLDRFLAVRRGVAASYDEGLAAHEEGPRALPVGPDGASNYYKYPVMLPSGLDRDAVKKELRGRFGVGLSGEVYSTPLHRQPIFDGVVRMAPGGLPVAEEVCARQVCLPVHSDMAEDEVAHVLSSVRSVISDMMAQVRA